MTDLENAKYKVILLTFKHEAYLLSLSLLRTAYSDLFWDIFMRIGMDSTVENMMDYPRCDFF
jgi:hypothetical protein